MIENMGIRNLADNTQSAYLQQLIAYAAPHFCMKQATVFKPFSIFCFFIEILEGAQLKKL